MSWADIKKSWDALEFSFTAIGVDLQAAYRVKSWRWFCVHVRGLLGSDSLIARSLGTNKPLEAPSE